ncbi:YxeA family protein [Enterococcus sp. DIV1368c]|uniref:YxeA family protein n=1 Tax=Enterococcus sp. DIV1368c TaxID=2774815 RepID=UPI003F2166A1
MGKLVKGLLVIALILGIGAFFIESKTEGFQALTDNFLSDKGVKEYYVKTSSGNKKGKDYLYTFEGYDEDGNQQTVKKLVDHELKQGRYLKIYAKGMQGKGWSEVSEKEVPTKALQKINI